MVFSPTNAIGTKCERSVSKMGTAPVAICCRIAPRLVEAREAKSNYVARE